MNEIILSNGMRVLRQHSEAHRPGFILYKFIEVSGRTFTEYVREDAFRRRSHKKAPKPKRVKWVTPTEKEYLSDTEECPVCMSNRVKIFGKTSCDHIICRKCLNTNKCLANGCPICRQEVTVCHELRKNKHVKKPVTTL